jgi:hypothetical protein
MQLLRNSSSACISINSYNSRQDFFIRIFNRNEMSQEQRTGKIKGTNTSGFTDQEQQFVPNPTQHLPPSPFHVKKLRDIQCVYK